MSTDYVAVGGPNLVPPRSGAVAKCVANAPGGPTQVLLTDREAEHIPGCNMAFLRWALEEIGGFDEQFRTAGDDVDICWRLQERGWTIGFHAAALVWHHRRNSVGAYWRQQRGYGIAEAQLEKKWPEKYNAPGHITWGGRVYSNALTYIYGGVGRIYQGVWGNAPFQRLYQTGSNGIWSIVLMPEWYLILVLLAILAGVGNLWHPLLWVWPLLIVAIGAVMLPAALCAARARFSPDDGSRLTRLGMRGLTVFLHVVQPAARLIGRLRKGLSPWRRRSASGLVFPKRRELRIWIEDWVAPDRRLHAIEAELKIQHPGTLRGGEFDSWDLEVREGIFGVARLLLAAEDHAGNTQLVRLRCWPRCSPLGMSLAGLFTGLTAAAALDHAWLASSLLGATSALILLQVARECAAALGVIHSVFHQVALGER